MNGTLLPARDRRDRRPHVLHRWVAVVVGLISWATSRSSPGGPSATTRRSSGSRSRPPSCSRSRSSSAALQVLTQLAELDADAPPRARRGHLGDCSAALAVTRYYTARVERVGRRGHGAGSAARGPAATTRRRRRPRRGDTVRAYIALTKPRIIELLLVTTVPAMVLATRDLPGDAAGGLGPARVLDADRRDARRGPRQRDQLLPRPRHRPADDPHPAPAAAGPPGRPGAGRRLRASCSASSRSR